MLGQSEGDNAMREETKSQNSLSRRQFGTVAGVAAVAAGTPSVAMAAGGTQIGEVTETAVSVATPRGAVSGFYVHPAKGAHPGVLAWRGESGLNVTSRNEARGLAKQGYSVLVLDRDAKDPAPVESDAVSAVAWLESQSHVEENRIGTPEWARLRLEKVRRY
jgi:carboxymethylenebutenolidase